MRFGYLSTIFCLVVLLANQAIAADSDHKIPRFVSLKSGEVNMRTGPGSDYPISWVYSRKHLPVMIIEEYENWRKIKDPEGDSGWVFRAMIDGSRHAMITGKLEPLYRRPDSSSPVLLRAERGVIGKLEACRDDWCELEIDDMKGWIKRNKIYGVLKDEDF